MSPRTTNKSEAPDFLTVSEAAQLLRLGRSAAYDQARLFEATGGTEGIPVVRLGRQFRIPRCKLEAVLGGPITWPLLPLNGEAITPTPSVPAKVRHSQSRRRTQLDAGIHLFPS